MKLCDCFNAHLKGIMPRGIFLSKNNEFPYTQKLLLEQKQDVEPRYTDTRLIGPRCFYGQMSLSRPNAHTFSLVKFTRLIRTLVNTDNGQFFLSRLK